jgi:hypothetical protein
MAGGVFLTVIRGDGSRLCHGDDVSAYRDQRGSIRGFTSFLEVLWSCSDDRRGIGAAGWSGLMEEADRARLVRYADSFANLRVLLLTHMHCRNTSGMPAQLPAGPPCLAAAPVRHSCSHKM